MPGDYSDLVGREKGRDMTSRGDFLAALCKWHKS